MCDLLPRCFCCVQRLSTLNDAKFNLLPLSRLGPDFCRQKLFRGDLAKVRVYGSVTTARQECQLLSVQAYRGARFPGITQTNTWTWKYTHARSFKNNQRGLTAVSNLLLQQSFFLPSYTLRTHCPHACTRSNSQDQLHLKGGRSNI